MRIHNALFLLCCTLSLIIGAYADGDREDGRDTIILPQNSSEPVRVPDVQTLLTNPERYSGLRIELDAIVSKMHSPNHMFSVADQISCPLCITKNTQSSMVVRYTGDLPKLRETVHIVGMTHPDPKFGYSIYAFEVET